jgi:hypothetical protein
MRGTRWAHCLHQGPVCLIGSINHGWVEPLCRRLCCLQMLMVLQLAPCMAGACCGAVDYH